MLLFGKIPRHLSSLSHPTVCSKSIRIFAKMSTPHTPGGMTSDEFRKYGTEMVNYIADYMEGIEQRQALSTVEPGYLRPLLPKQAPEHGEKFEDIMGDVEKIIMPGVTHWKSPNFHAYFPATGSYPSYLADMLSSAIGCIGFSWICSPACTELETVMMDWLAKAVGLPETFLAESDSGEKLTGGGVIQGTASEATLVSLLAARAKYINKLTQLNPNMSTAEALGKLVFYGTKQAHSSIEKAAVIGGVILHMVPHKPGTFDMDIEGLRQKIKEDRAKGLYPAWVCATLGTTSSCAFDDLTAVSEVCKSEDLWMHVDAAYAGAAFICPEFRDKMTGIEFADSYTFNPHKWMLVHFDCCALWVRDRNILTQAFKVDPQYLKNKASDAGLVVDYRDWQIPLGRRFRALKLWFVLRSYGIEGLRAHIRNQCELAKEFLALVEADDRFEITAPPKLGLVCFRLKGDNELSRRLLESITDEAKIYLVHTVLDGVYTIRFCVCAPATESRHIQQAWEIISRHAAEVLSHRRMSNVETY